MQAVKSKENLMLGVEIAHTSDTLAEGYAQTKVYCANCVHCKVVPELVDRSDTYYLRVRCDAGKWRKKLGDEKIYKYFTVARRSMDFCESYEPMGDAREFIRELKKSLPIRDEVYGSSQT